MAKKKKYQAKTSHNIASESSPAYNAKPYDWLNPARPATDEELDQLIAESENSPSLSFEESKKLGYELLAKWRKERK